MAFTRVNIAVRPPEEVIEEAIKISNEISKEAEPFFILDDDTFFPHITIYSPEYPAKNLDKVLETVEKIQYHDPAKASSHQIKSSTPKL